MQINAVWPGKRCYYLFAKGDKIVYPMYGAGVIEELENREIDGDDRVFYVLKIPVGSLKIMIAAMNAEQLGIRRIYGKEEILHIIGSVASRPIEMPENWNQRYKANMEKVKSGKLSEVALVFRNLLLRERERGLSSAEKKMLTTAKQIILSELILSQDVEKSTAEDILMNIIEPSVAYGT